jgi:hypothetical protein
MAGPCPQAGQAQGGPRSGGRLVDAGMDQVRQRGQLPGGGRGAGLAGAAITGQLSCSGAQLTGTDRDGNALAADGMKVGGAVFLDGGFTAAGTISLASAHVRGRPEYARKGPQPMQSQVSGSGDES